MGARNRERESKWYTLATMDEVRTKLEDVLGSRLSDVVAASGKDIYWALTDNKFVRIRERDAACQLTVKVKDKDSNHDRVEIDVDCVDGVKQVSKLLSVVLGEPTGELAKQYWVYWLKGKDEYTNVSLYAVKGYPGTFMEIEASTLAEFTLLETLVVEALREELQLTSEAKSMYELFILPLKDRFVI